MVEYEWYKTDEEALNSSLSKWSDFISKDYPNYIRLRPKKS
jgi:hypothetical protein